MKKKKAIAMILAGGQGSRLYELTDSKAKPAVSFGGKYRIIDFVLSNCANSSLDTVGVLTQYKPHILSDYIGAGEVWDLDRIEGGAFILPPYKQKNQGDWYNGTANAVYQNFDFIKKYSPEFVIILSADHIYKMDYQNLISFHTENNSDCTIATINVKKEDASRFGILGVDASNRVISFKEKPKKPKSTIASMGIYVFSVKALYATLEKDEKNISSSHDFGKDIIPKMISDGLRIFSYSFSGYWRDVGTIESLWEANMDLLNEGFKDLFSTKNRIYTRGASLPPALLLKGSKAQNSLCSGGSTIFGEIENSVIGEGVLIEKGASIKNSVIMKGAVVKKGVQINYAIVDENTVVDKNITGTNSKIALESKHKVEGRAI